MMGASNTTVSGPEHGYSIAKSFTSSSVRSHTAADFVDFVDILSRGASVWHEHKKAETLKLWLPCQFNLCPDRSYPRCMNDLAKPTRLLGLDFDADETRFSAVQKGLDELGCDYYIHTTMSFQPGVNERCRGVIHLHTTMETAEDYRLMYLAMMEFFGSRGQVLDAACKNISRKFYMPGSNRSTGHRCVDSAALERGPLDATPFIQKAREDAALKEAMRMLERSETLSLMAKTAGKQGLDGIAGHSAKPYYNHAHDHNIANRDKVQWFMTLDSRGSGMAHMASHIVGYCAKRFGPHVVSTDMMVTALTDWSGVTTHNNFAQSIIDARKRHSA